MEGRQQEASFTEGPLCAQLCHRCYFHPPTKEVLSQDSYQCHLTLHPHTHSLHPAPRSSLHCHSSHVPLYSSLLAISLFLALPVLPTKYPLHSRVLAWHRDSCFPLPQTHSPTSIITLHHLLAKHLLPPESAVSTGSGSMGVS